MTRPFALLLACLLLVGFAGCGDDEEEATPEATATEAPAETPTPEDTGGEQGTACAAVEKPAPKDASL